MKHLLLGLLLTIVLPVSLQAQTVKRLEGVVKDAKTGETIPFAHVNVKGSTVATLTSRDGHFMLRLDEQSAKGTLVISSLGFKSFNGEIAKLKSPLEIKLKPDVQLLQEVNVSAYSPEDLIHQAVKKVPENYFQETTMLRGFYRESGTVNGQYGHVAEAIVNIEKGPYKGKLSGGWDDVSLVKGRELGMEDSLAIDVWKSHPFPIEGGIYYTANHDVAKHVHSLQYPFIRKDHFHQYDYTLKGKSKVEDREVYVIGFDQKERINQALFQGEILIDTETMAFVKIHYQLSDGHLDEVPVTRHRGVEIHKTKHYGEVQYRMMDGKWYLSYSLEGEAFQADAYSNTMKEIYQEAFGQDYMTTSRSFELVVTYMQYGDIQPLPKEDLLGYGDVLLEKVEQYDENYWDQYNYITIGSSLKEALSRN